MTEDALSLTGQCLQFMEEHFEAIPSLARLPGVVAQQVLEHMMRCRKAGSRTMNHTNITKFLQHQALSPTINSLLLMIRRFEVVTSPDNDK